MVKVEKGLIGAVERVPLSVHLGCVAVTVLVEVVEAGAVLVVGVVPRIVDAIGKRVNVGSRIVAVTGGDIPVGVAPFGEILVEGFLVGQPIGGGLSP